jgi:hypothetical protein
MVQKFQDRLMTGYSCMYRFHMAGARIASPPRMAPGNGVLPGRPRVRGIVFLPAFLYKRRKKYESWDPQAAFRQETRCG